MGSRVEPLGNRPPGFSHPQVDARAVADRFRRANAEATTVGRIRFTDVIEDRQPTSGV